VIAGGALIGPLLDRFSRRILLLTDSVLRAVVVASVPVVALVGEVQLWHLYVVAATYGLLKIVPLGVVPAVTPELVPKEQIHSAVALEAIAYGAAGMAGPALGGVLIAAFDAPAVLALDAASYLVLALCVFAMRSKLPRPEGETSVGLAQSFGWAPVVRMLRRDAVLVTITVGFALFAGHEAASVLRDKWLLRQAMERGPVANPGSWPVTGPEELRELMAAHGAPMILKPANHQGSIGTQIIREPADVEAAWTACVVEDQISGMPDMVLPIRMLAEQFVEGPEYSVEALVRDGDILFANVTRKYLYPGARPVEQGHVVPADLPADLRGRLIDDTGLVLATTGFRTGFAHCEWIVRNGVPYLMECAGRIPGDWIVGLIDLAWGMDTIREYLAVMRGEAPSRLPSAPLGGSAVWFLDAPAGRIRSVGGVAAARALPGVLVVEILAQTGDTARPPRSGRDRTGFVVAAAPSGAEALRLARQAGRLIRFATAGHEPIPRHGARAPSAEPVP
jgi:biotin carboxylase